jgi:ABC-type nitrate/sulfonate/bicarbonate transport system substrate-binding protein
VRRARSARCDDIRNQIEVNMGRYTHALGLAFLCLSCTRAPEKSTHPGGFETLVLRYEGSVNNVTYPELAEDLGYLAPIKLEYLGNNATGGPHSIQAVVTGDVDFGSSFNGAIIKLIAAGAPIRSVLASYGTDELTFNAFYTLEDSPLRRAKDLIGKKIAMNTLGAHAEFALKEYLVRGGLSTKEIEQITMLVLPPVNGELALRTHQVDVANFSVILRDKALRRGGIRMLFSDQQLFGQFNAGSFVMSEKFMAANPNTARRFVQGTGRAIEWARNTPRAQVIERFTAIVNKRKRNEDTSSLAFWKSSGIATKHGELTDRDFQMWVDWLVQDGELKKGQLKIRDLYTNQFQAAPGELASNAR